MLISVDRQVHSPEPLPIQSMDLQEPTSAIVKSMAWYDFCQSYHLEKLLSKGTYGKVFLAREVTSNEFVTVKMLSKEQTDECKFVNELLLSITISGHRNIISTRHIGFELADGYILIQEYANGGDLQEYFAAGTDFNNMPLATIVKNDICEALKFLHSVGYVHGDLKGENIVLCASTSSSTEGASQCGFLAKLIDFDTLQAAGVTVNRGRVGTSPYDAPETFEDCRMEGGCEWKTCTVTFQLDIFALGVTIFALVTGVFPWIEARSTDSNFIEFRRWQFNLRLTPPYDYWRNFSPGLRTFLSRMLSTDPRKRPSAHEAQHLVLG